MKNVHCYCLTKVSLLFVVRTRCGRVPSLDTEWSRRKWSRARPTWSLPKQQAVMWRHQNKQTVTPHLQYNVIIFFSRSLKHFQEYSSCYFFLFKSCANNCYWERPGRLKPTNQPCVDISFVILSNYIFFPCCSRVLRQQHAFSTAFVSLK